MSRPFWLRPLRLTEKSVLPGESIIKAAVRRESLETLLRTSAALLLESTNADRAGVWAEEMPGDPVWPGRLAQIDATGHPTELCKVNAFEVFPVEFNDVNSPLEFFAPVFPAGPRDFFDGMSVAVGMPLKVDDRILGAMLIGSARPGKLAGREIVENLSAEIALSLFANRARDQQERTQRSLHLRDEIDNLILTGAAVEEILERITSAAVRQTGAQFVGVARRTELGLQWEALCGPNLPPHTLRQALFTVATAVFLDRDSVIRDFPNGSLPGLSIVGLPLDFSRDESLLLLAGYRSGDRIPVETLDGFRVMAANARFVATARENHAAYRSLFESTSEALIVSDSAGRILEANRQARELLRWKSDLGSKIGLTEFFVHPDAGEFDFWFRHAISATRAPFLQARMESGLEVRLALRQTLGGNHRLLLSLEEGSLVQRAENRWRQTQAELCSVLDAVHAGVLLLACNGRIRTTNARFGMLFGLEAQAMSALETFDDLAQMIETRFRIPSAYRAPWDSFQSGCGDAVHDELEMATPVVRVIERFARPVLDEEGRRLGWLEAFWDVTGQRQIQSKLQQTEKMAAVGQLVSGIAHELSNPLTSIMGYAQLLLNQRVSEIRSGEARLIFEEAGRASRIVKNLLSYARQAEPERTRTDVNEVVERTVALRDYELKTQNIVVRCDLESNLPATLADPHQLQQVVLNLLINAEQAIRATRGKGRIKLSTRKVSASRLAIEISDDGPGIAPEISGRVFDPFFTTKPPGIGTGLGLAIVHRIVEQHEGKVSFENLPVAGAKFTIELPLLSIPARDSRLALSVIPAPAKKIPAAQILVVEDEPTVAQFVADVLREDGHNVEAVMDSQEGLLRVSRRRYDMIICDLRMPRLDGPAFYDALVRSRNTARHHILFITGDTLGPHTVEFLKSHQLQFLTKPFLVEELKLAVYRVLEHAAAPTGLASSEAHG
jgi:signal transduction histidine kinase/CheY-like chemotaxis protein